jgi:hypothetical protein
MSLLTPGDLLTRGLFHDRIILAKLTSAGTRNGGHRRACETAHANGIEASESSRSPFSSETQAFAANVCYPESLQPRHVVYRSGCTLGTTPEELREIPDFHERASSVRQACSGSSTESQRRHGSKGRKFGRRPVLTAHRHRQALSVDLYT